MAGRAAYVVSRPVYYESGPGALYRKRGQRIEIYSVWATTPWLPLFVPARDIGAWRRISALRAWWIRLRLRARYRRHERIEVF